MNKRAFTLAELMIVIGTIGILTGVVITAVNPKRHVTVATNAKRLAASQVIQRAVQQYLIDGGTLPLIAELIPICAPGVDGIANECVNLDVLIAQNYITELPIDAAEPNEHYTGFEISVSDDDQVEIDPTHYDPPGGGGDNDDEEETLGPQLVWFDTQNAPSGTIQRQPLNGGPAVTVLDNAGTTGNVFNMLMDGSEVYWNPNGIRHMPLQGGTPVDLTPPGSINRMFAVDSNGQYVYYRYGEQSMRRVSFGGTVEPLFPVLDNASVLPAVDKVNGHIYYWHWQSSTYSLSRRDLNGQNLTLIENDMVPLGLVIHGNYLYYAVCNHSQLCTQIKRRDISDPDQIATPEVLLTAQVGQWFAPLRPMIILPERNEIYFWNYAVIDGEPSGIMRTPLNGGGPLVELRTFSMSTANPMFVEFGYDPINERFLWTEESPTSTRFNLMTTSMSDAADGVISSNEVSLLIPEVFAFTLYLP